VEIHIHDIDHITEVYTAQETPSTISYMLLDKAFEIEEHGLTEVASSFIIERYVINCDDLLERLREMSQVIFTILICIYRDYSVASLCSALTVIIN
jgi:hypothetical protein